MGTRQVEDWNEGEREKNSIPPVEETEGSGSEEQLDIFPDYSENVFNATRTFPTGATRSSLDGKFDYEGFFNPAVLAVVAKYLHKHRIQADGRLRDSDNWQKGISKDDYMKSALRHVMDAWAIHRGYEVYREKLLTGGEKTHYVLPNRAFVDSNWERVPLRDALCGVIFNMNGYILEDIKSAGGFYA